MKDIVIKILLVIFVLTLISVLVGVDGEPLLDNETIELIRKQ